MGISIKSNINAMRLIRNLGRSSADLSTNFERLSSGLRINKASDDAAGLAVSENLRTNIRVKNRGRQNVGDGTSLLNIADGALDQIGTLLIRMAELAEQAANGTYTRTQRVALDKEFQSLDKEISRISKTTKFNGLDLLKGKARDLNFTQLTNTTGAGITAGLTGNATAISNDGQYLTYYNASASGGAQLEQVDTLTGQVKVISKVAILGDITATGSGEDVYFTSTDNINGLNASGNTQIFRYNRNTNAISKVTNSQTIELFGSFSVSADGSKLAFSSSTNYAEGGDASSASGTNVNLELYVMDIATGLIKKAGFSGSSSTLSTASFSADGSYLSFTSTSNITGNNADNSLELFVAQTDNLSGSLRQATNSVGLLPTFAISRDGDLYFNSSLNLTGQNSGGVGQVFKYSYSSSSLQQITSLTTGIGHFGLSLNSDGTSITFLSSNNLTGENSNGIFQVFKYDILSGSYQQTSNASSNLIADHLLISGDGNSLVTRGLSFPTANPTGNNPDLNSEIFLINVGKGASEFNIEAGSGAAGSISTLISGLDGGLRGLGSYLLTSQSAARGALEGIQQNIQNLSGIRNQIGVGVSRLEIANRVLLSQGTQFEAARSRIIDADIAEETAKVIRNQILQRSGAALLASANQRLGIALKLLGVE